LAMPMNCRMGSLASKKDKSGAGADVGVESDLAATMYSAKAS